MLFARVDHESTAPAAMRLLNRSLILDHDGYGAPIFSADGRHLAMRGNSYGYSLAVFEFPSLRLVLSTTAGELAPGHPYPPELHKKIYAWPKQNIAFGAGVLWTGTPEGSLIEIDLNTHQSTEHDLLPGASVTALGATAGGTFAAATGGGDIALVSVTGDRADTREMGADALRGQVAAFLASTSVVLDDRELWKHLVTTDRSSNMEPGRPGDGHHGHPGRPSVAEDDGIGEPGASGPVELGLTEWPVARSNGRD